MWTKRTGKFLFRSDVAYAIRDKRNRVLGLDVCVTEMTYTPAEEDSPWRYRNAPGVVYAVVAHQTRNGEWYGVRPNGKEFPTLEQAKHYVEQVIADREKVYRKKYRPV